jgi:hypothetical protein
MPKYKIKEGYEHVVFSQEGVHRISTNEIDSRDILNNPILILIEDKAAPVQPVTPPAPIINQPVQAPAAPVAPAETQTQEGAK